MSAAAAASQTIPTQSSQPQSQSDVSTPSHNQPRRRKPKSKRGGQAGGPSAAQPGIEAADGTNTGSLPAPRGGGRARAARDGLLALRPSSVAPGPQKDSAADATLQQDSTSSRGQPRRRGRGAPASGRHQTRIVQTRQFGGSLTGGANAAQSPGTGNLQANAPEFRPGQAVEVPSPETSSSNTTKPNPQKQPRPAKRRLSKSTAPDIASRIHDDINNGQYECPICTSEVLRKSKVWSCHTCWTVFHLDCIKKWSNNPQPDAPQNPDGIVTPRQWRCPGCNLPQETKPKSYACWCEKETEPRPISGLPPHSCGQTCGKPRLLPKKCPHPCELICHAGPCPPCHHVGPTQLCFCGKESSTRRCVDTNYDTGWSCEKPCGDIMPCGEHNCPRECHEGLCGACEVRIDARCYCGKEEKPILCCDKDDEKSSMRVHLGESEEQLTEQWTGLFQCTNNCERYFDCGKHQCQKPCHAADNIVEHCPRSPDVVATCPCGKTPLTEISDQPRQSCEDLIPNCSKTCLKELPCGHGCKQTCHTGECMPCLERITIQCRCERTSLTTICHQGSEEAPQCTRICKTTLNCGRHECGERCCSGERKATDRQSSKRKQRPLNSTQRIEDYFEAEHICTRICGRLLKCGSHTCEELCHKGPCGSCREAIFDEISCHCGRTILQPPLPCGTKPPACRFDCERPKACGHPQVQHNCHSDEENCPKCPFFTQKDCLCGKKSLKNQQCWFTDVRCGEVCGRKLKCGSHSCRKSCHKPGECEDQVGSCQQSCGKPKKSCGHPCEEPCHAPYPCREEKPCAQKALITCACQHNKSEVRCSASKTSPGNASKVLPCTDECARLERNRKLALALEIDPTTHTDDHIPYSAETLSLYQSSNLDHKWLKETEATFRIFAADEAERRIRFKPMPPPQRTFLHSLSNDFGFDSESMDPEPHRHVAVFKTPRFVAAPTKTLRDCVRIRRNQAVEAAAEAQTLYHERQAEKARNSNISEPYNGLLLSNPRFALTLDELETEISAVLGTVATNPSRLSFNIQFLPTSDVALKARPAGHTERTLDLMLKEAKTPLARALGAQGIGALQLARFDDSLNVLRRESDDAAEGGWSKVAAKAAAPKRAIAPQVPGAGRSGNGFTVLGNLAARKKVDEKVRDVKKKPENVVEDWEMAEVEEERKEEMAAGVSDDAAEAGGDSSTAIEAASIPPNNSGDHVAAAENSTEPVETLPAEPTDDLAGTSPS